MESGHCTRAPKSKLALGDYLMRNSAWLLAVLVVSCRDAPETPGSGAKAALLAANAAYDKALIDGDADALRRFYTDDFLIIDARAQVHGKADQVRFMTEQVDLLKGETDDVRVTMLSPETALLTGRLVGRYRMDGRENDFTERYTSIWVRDGEHWRLKHEHSSLAPRK